MNKIDEQMQLCKRFLDLARKGITHIREKDITFTDDDRMGESVYHDALVAMENDLIISKIGKNEYFLSAEISTLREYYAYLVKRRDGNIDCSPHCKPLLLDDVYDSDWTIDVPAGLTYDDRRDISDKIDELWRLCFDDPGLDDPGLDDNDDNDDNDDDEDDDEDDDDDDDDDDDYDEDEDDEYDEYKEIRARIEQVNVRRKELSERIRREIGKPVGDSIPVPDDITLKVLLMCVREKRANVSFIQRKFGIGYAKSARIVDWMEEKGYATRIPSTGAMCVRLSESKFFELYGKRMADILAAEEENRKKESIERAVITLYGPDAVSAELDPHLERLKELEERLKHQLGNDLEVFMSDTGLMIRDSELHYPDGTCVEFIVRYSGDSVILCDGGKAKRVLSLKPGYGEKRVKKALDKLAADNLIELDEEGRLVADVSDITSIMAKFYHLSWEINELY